MDVHGWLLAVYIALHAPLCVYGLHRGWLQIALLRPPPDQPLPPLGDPPVVSVQLPLFNERDVAARVIFAAAELDWPMDRLEIQVLDDSTDDTTSIASQACAELRDRGFSAQVIHRSDRSGFKAGALAAGLEQASGELVAIFDADFLPPADFLRRTVPYLRGGAGMVQARWGHLNERSSLLTQLQAVLLDGHFVVEQSARYRQGHWSQFNGTAGIWRREVIAQAGGWETDTLTEDLDLSYRAQLAGARFVYLHDLVAPAELPADLTAFKAQQHRWGKGMAQALRKSGWRILSASAPLSTKVEALLHLTSACAWPLVAFVSALLPVALLLRGIGWMRVPAGVDLAIFALATVAIVSFYAVGAVAARRRHLARRLAVIPLAMALGVGLSVAQSAAVLQGLFGETGVFERTPKAGSTGRSSYRARLRPIVLLELTMAVWLLGAAGVAASWGLTSAIPFLVLLGSGYGAVGLGGALGWLRRGHHRSNSTAARTGSQVSPQSQAGSDQAPVSVS